MAIDINKLKEFKKTLPGYTPDMDTPVKNTTNTPKRADAPRKTPPVTISKGGKSMAKATAVNYDAVEKAEKVIQSLIYKDRNGNDRLSLTTSQIRKFLTAVNLVRNKVDFYMVQNKGVQQLSPELTAEVKFLKVNLLYQVGRNDNQRNNPVREFVEKGNLAQIIDSIGNNIKEFQKFCRYVEALVAYHKYYGGKDK